MSTQPNASADDEDDLDLELEHEPQTIGAHVFRQLQPLTPRSMAHTIDALSAAILGEQQKLVNAEREILGMIEHINRELNQLCVEELQLKSSVLAANGDGGDDGRDAAAGVEMFGDGGGGCEVGYSITTVAEAPLEAAHDDDEFIGPSSYTEFDAIDNINQQQLELSAAAVVGVNGAMFEVEEIDEDDEIGDLGDDDVKVFQR